MKSGLRETAGPSTRALPPYGDCRDSARPRKHLPRNYSWRQPRGKWMVSSVNSHTNATGIWWHLWEIDLRFAMHYLQGGSKLLESSIRLFTRNSFERTDRVVNIDIYYTG